MEDKGLGESIRDVHLLARDVVSADRVQIDLEGALREELVPGFAEDIQDLLVAA